MYKRLLAFCLALALLLAPWGNVLHAAEVDFSHHANWMQQEGILRGSSAGLEMDKAVTTAEMAAFLHRALGWEVPASPISISDVASGHWAHGVIQAAIANGAIVLDAGRAYPSKPLSALEAFNMAKRVDLTLKLAPAATLSRGQLLDALGEALSTTITVVHTNDSHGRILSNDQQSIFGWEKVATIIEEARRSNPNTLVLDAGDSFHGTNEAQFFNGVSVVAAMNSAGVDMMVPGNHDFNYGYEHLLTLKQEAAFAILAANVKKGEDYILPPYVVRELAGLKVAVVGLATPETTYKTHPKNVVGLDFLDPAETAAAMVNELADDTDLIIVLSHLGADVDQSIAEQVAGIDLIIGGHSHTNWVNAKKVGNTYIAQAGEHTKQVGQQDLIFYQGKLVDVLSRPVDYSSDVLASPRTGKLALEVFGKVQREMETVIGQTSFDLDGERANVRTKETNLGNMIADVMLAATDADIAMTNGGGIRASIASGDVTVSEVVAVLPFSNTLYTANLTGLQVKGALEHSVSLYPNQHGAFLQVAGLSFSFDPSKPAGERIVSVKVNGKDLDDTTTYKVATNDFIAAGGDGYVVFNDGTDKVDTGLMLSEMLINYLREQGDLIPQASGRVIVIEK